MNNEGAAVNSQPLGVTVVIPVGPFDANKRWLRECQESVLDQTYPVNEILIIDDMAGFGPGDLDCRGTIWLEPWRRVWTAPWRLGVGAAFNCGVGLARNELVFLLGSDDWLEPDCIEECVKAYEGSRRPGDTYFWVGIRYSDRREDQYLPTNAAMVTKALWRKCGGFPLEAASGAPDAALMSIFMTNPAAGRILGVCGDRPLYNYRVHDSTDTAGRAPWQGVILQTRDLVTKQWGPPEWTERSVIPSVPPPSRPQIMEKGLRV